MKLRFLTVALLVLLSFVLLSGAAAQDPAPTLVPPTLVPTQPSADVDVLPSESGIARIAESGVVRVGMLYNEPPFGELNIRGAQVGFDADLARAIAEAWGVQVEFHQATRQTGIDMVRSGMIDLLIAAQPHDRSLDSVVEFSQSYFPAEQALVVREGDGAAVLEHMANRIVGVVMGSRGEQAVEYWRGRAEYDFAVVRFATLDQALTALDEQEIDGVVSQRTRLARLIDPSTRRFVDETVMPDPFAIAMQRQDVNLRNLVNHTLQYLYVTGKLDQIHRANFLNAPYPDQTFVVWTNVSDSAPTPGQFSTDVPFPTYVVPRLQTERSLRVAGLRVLPGDAPESARRLDSVNRALINAMAERWQVNVVPVPEDGRSPIEQVAAGDADIAIGVEPDWTNANQVDFTSYYLVHGDRLMVRTADNIGGFGDLRGKIVGIFQDDPDAREVIAVHAERNRAIVDDFFTVLREQDAAYTMLVDNNASVMFGDSLKLIPHVEQNPDTLELTTDANGRALWYTRQFVGMAVPRNDIAFRLLVEYTLQELARDGSLTEILRPVTAPQDAPVFDIWAGSSDYLGYNLAGS